MLLRDAIRMTRQLGISPALLRYCQAQDLEFGIRP